MIIQKLNGELQNIAHSGHAQDFIYIKILDAYYKIGGIEKVITRFDDNERVSFVIKAEVGSGEKKGDNAD